MSELPKANQMILSATDVEMFLRILRNDELRMAYVMNAGKPLTWLPSELPDRAAALSQLPSVLAIREKATSGGGY